MESLVAKILKEQLHLPSEGMSLTLLQGDASYRIYYRVLLGDGRSLILMKMPEGKASASEEITNLKEKPAELPYLNIARFLKERGLPVPTCHYYDEKNGLLFLEDFGDETLEKRLASCTEEEKKDWYRKAIDLLVLFQEKGPALDGSCIAHRRSFDATLFNWEFDHFVEYGIEARSGQTVAAGDLKKIRQETRRITETLIRLPQTLIHRDFQSRNLMVQNETLGLLDFQDALMGPLPYDLVALLRDSYVTIPPLLVTTLIDYYLDRRARKGGLREDFENFRTLFDQMTIQRKLKDAGRFVYIDRVKKNPSFLKHIPTSLGYVREAFERRTELEPLYEVLKKYVPEFT